MELFSEIYNSYYQIMKSILTDMSPLTLEDLRIDIAKTGYEESLLFLIPKLTSGEWTLLKQEDNLFLSRITKDFYVPLTLLQRRYIKTILQDERILLFLSEDECRNLQDLFAEDSPLWKPEDIYYYDRFSDGDDYKDPAYRQHFSILMSAITNHQYVDICYESKALHRIHHHYLPCRLEYSIKNDKFRLLGMERSKSGNHQLATLNLDRMNTVCPVPDYPDTIPDIDKEIQHSYYKEPVRIRIHTRRNALERTMLQFANYHKNTTKIDDDTYECLIYYNKNMETELLIEVLSFGPMLEVLGNEHFLHLLKQRLRRQKSINQNLLI